MAHYLITGGTGFIGTALVRRLLAGGHHLTVFTRHPEKYADSTAGNLTYVGDFQAIAPEKPIDVVINLAGAGIGDKRWSKKRKQILLQSRVDFTRDLLGCLARLHAPPQVMISGSAVGWYGAGDDKPLDETAGFHSEFTHDLCAAWEEAAEEVRTLGTRLCIIRLGVVLGPRGGMLKRLLPPFYAGLGGRIGSGRQMLTWVHREDVLRGIEFLVNNPALSGVFNLTAPEAVSNSEFTRVLGKVMHRPTVFPLPAFVVKTVFGEMGERLLLEGQNVIPRQLQSAGFAFEYPRLEGALTQILGR